MSNRQYVLVGRHEEPSHLNGGVMWRLVYYSLDDGYLYEMTVDSSYRNFRRQGWDHLVKDPNPWGVYEGLRRTNRVSNNNLPVLTADSMAERVWRAEDHQQALKLVEADQRQRNPDMFQELFEKC